MASSQDLKMPELKQADLQGSWTPAAPAEVSDPVEGAVMQITWIMQIMRIM